MDVSAGQETEFLSLAMQFEALMLRKQYGRAELVRDEASPRRFYAVRYWTDTAAAASCHADPDAQALIAMIDTIASVTQLVNGEGTLLRESAVYVGGVKAEFRYEKGLKAGQYWVRLKKRGETVREYSLVVRSR